MWWVNLKLLNKYKFKFLSLELPFLKLYQNSKTILYKAQETKIKITVKKKIYDDEHQ